MCNSGLSQITIMFFSLSKKKKNWSNKIFSDDLDFFSSQLNVITSYFLFLVTLSLSQPRTPTSAPKYGFLNQPQSAPGGRSYSLNGSLIGSLGSGSGKMIKQYSQKDLWRQIEVEPKQIIVWILITNHIRLEIDLSWSCVNWWNSYWI